MQRGQIPEWSCGPNTLGAFLLIFWFKKGWPVRPVLDVAQKSCGTVYIRVSNTIDLEFLRRGIDWGTPIEECTIMPIKTMV